MAKILGIDLGTTNSCMAVMEGGEPAVLEKAGVTSARAVVLALDDDDATLFATVVIRDAAPEAPIIARVDGSRNIERIHRAALSRFS